MMNSKPWAKNSGHPEGETRDRVTDVELEWCAPMVFKRPFLTR
jgi:hypothetical protein